MACRGTPDSDQRAMEDLLDRAGGEVAAGSCARKDPVGGKGPCEDGLEGAGGALGEERVAVLPAFAAAHVDETALGIDIPRPQPDHLPCT